MGQGKGMTILHGSLYAAGRHLHVAVSVTSSPGTGVTMRRPEI
jgi:hypothetical protein